MKITRITKTYSRTVNVGDYNSLQWGMSAEAELEPGDNPEQAGEALYAKLKVEVELDIITKLNEIQAGHDDIFNHAAAYHKFYKKG